MRLDEARRCRDALEIFEHRVESLDVTDLNQTAVALREFNQLSRLRHVIRHRLLDEQMFAASEQRFRNFKMRRGRRDDVECVTAIESFFDGTEGTRAKFFREGLGGLRSRIEYACECHRARRRHFGINARVMLTQRACAEHGHSNGILFFQCHAREFAIARRALTTRNSR